MPSVVELSDMAQVAKVTPACFGASSSRCEMAAGQRTHRVVQKSRTSGLPARRVPIVEGDASCSSTSSSVRVIWSADIFRRWDGRERASGLDLRSTHPRPRATLAARGRRVVAQRSIHALPRCLHTFLVRLIHPCVPMGCLLAATPCPLGCCLRNPTWVQSYR